MHGDAIGPPQFGQQGVGDGIGLRGAPGLAHIGHVVDVYPKTGHAARRVNADGMHRFGRGSNCLWTPPPRAPGPYR